MTRVTLEAAGNDTLQEFLELTFIQWLWVQVRAESHTVVQTPTLWFQSFQGVNCLWRISIIYTFQENYISRNMCIRVTKLGSTVQSHAALNMDAKCSEPSSALTLSPHLFRRSSACKSGNLAQGRDLLCAWLCWPCWTHSLAPGVMCGSGFHLPKVCCD